MFVILLGTRAELIKMFPIMHEFEKRNVEWRWISTGQHDLTNEIAEFKIKPPSAVLSKFYEKDKTILNSTIWIIRMMLKAKNNLSKDDVVLVHGDTMSTLIGAFAAKLVRAKLVHVEAGLRSGNLKEPFPEELIRRIVDKLSDVLFAPHHEAQDNLKKEGRDSYVVGNTIVDSLNVKRRNSNGRILALIHRQETLKNKKRLENFVHLINSLKKVVFLYHENTKKTLIKAGLWESITAEKQKQLQYSIFKNYLSRSRAVLTDSGGVSEECLILGVPCLIFRDATEREEVINYGIGIKAIGKSVSELEDFIKNAKREGHPYGKNPSKKIVDILLEVFD